VVPEVVGGLSSKDIEKRLAAHKRLSSSVKANIESEHMQGTPPEQV